MEATPRRVLVVVNRPVSNRALAHAVRRRAAEDDCAFTLLVPAVARGFHRVVDPEDACCQEAERTIQGLLPALEQAAGAPVAARIGSHEVLAAIEDAVTTAATTRSSSRPPRTGSNGCCAWTCRGRSRLSEWM